MPRFSDSIHWTYKAAAVIAVAAGLYTFFWILLAKSWASTDPGQDARPNATIPETGPNHGLTHVKIRSTSGLGTYYVLLDQEDWQRARAADSCEHAQNLHRIAVARYADVTPNQKGVMGDVLQSLPATLDVKWVEATNNEVAGTFNVELSEHAPTGRYAFVRPDHVDADFLSALQAMFPTQLHRQQLAQLLAGALQKG